MILLFRQQRHLGHEPESRAEIFENEVPRNRIPIRQQPP